MSFASRSGCPMCSIVARAASASASASIRQSPTSSLVPADSPSSSPSPFPGGAASQARRSRAAKIRGDDEPEVVWHDENFTVYRERSHPVSSIAHLVVIFNLHVPSLYMLSSSDIPLLVHLRDLASRLLTDLTSTSNPPTSAPASPSTFPLSTPPSSADAEQPGNTESQQQRQFRVGFITPPWKDVQIPIKDHLHAHAYVAPMDLCGWWRSVAYSPLAWYAVEDLIAEIREESTNNRIRSPDTNTNTEGDRRRTRLTRPIDRVPNAGARSGTADGHETTNEGLASLTDLESGRSQQRASTGSGSGYSYGSGRSPVTLPSPARLGAPSHLDLNAAYAGVASSSTPTPTKTSFGRTSSLGAESVPGSSLGQHGQLLSPAYPASS